MSNAVLCCYRDGLMTFGSRSVQQVTVEFTYWDSLSLALDASMLAPCGPLCRSDHLVVWTDPDGRTRTMKAAAPNTEKGRRNGQTARPE